MGGKIGRTSRVPSATTSPIKKLAVKLIKGGLKKGLKKKIGPKSKVLKKTPTFTIKTSSYFGHPIVEVLKNGGPIHVHDEHFRFGLSKTTMLLACLDILKEFGRRSKGWRSWRSRTVQDGFQSIRVSVEFEPRFEAYGRDIEARYLRLEIEKTSTHLSLGVEKCRAVWSVRKQLAMPLVESTPA